MNNMKYYTTCKEKIQCGDSSFYEKEGRRVWRGVRGEKPPRRGARRSRGRRPKGARCEASPCGAGAKRLGKSGRKSRSQPLLFCGEAGGKTKA